MAYIAIKPVRFDRRYSIGEIIPDVVVDLARAPKLQEMGLIQPLPEASDGAGYQETAGDAGGVNTPAAAENATGEAAEAKKKTTPKK